MSVLESVHPSIPMSGLIVDPTFAKTVGDRESLALASTAYEVMITPLGQKVLRGVELNKDVKDADERFDKTTEYLKGNGVDLNEHTLDAMIALAALFVNGTVSIQNDRGIVGARTPAVANFDGKDVMRDESIYAVGNTMNPADQQQKDDNGDLKISPEKPKKRDS